MAEDDSKKEEGGETPQKRPPFYKREMFSEDGKLDWPVIIWKTCIMIAGFVLVYVIAAIVLDVYEERTGRGIGFFAEWLAESAGYWGVAFYTFLTDWLIAPLTVDVIYPFLTEFDTVAVILVMGIASALGGVAGYWTGYLFRKTKWIKNLTANFGESGERMIRRYGPLGVLLGAATPIPFSTCCWVAGMLKVPFGPFCLACLFRIPRIALYYAIVMAII